MDEIELSQQREQRDRDIALAQHAASQRVVATPADGLCVDCDEAIEPARLRALGATERCATCAHRAELAGRRHG